MPDADGRTYRTSDAILNGAYRRSQVLVRYSDGTETDKILVSGSALQ